MSTVSEWADGWEEARVGAPGRRTSLKEHRKDEPEPKER